jgi:hypothetical protein
MKAKMFFLSFTLFFVFTSASAQFSVLENGRVQVGKLKLDNEDVGNVTTMQVFGQIGDMRAGSKLAFGDFGLYANAGWNVFIGEYGTYDSDKLWLHGKLGFYLTRNGLANDAIAYYNPVANSNIILTTGLIVNGVSVTSDARLSYYIGTERPNRESSDTSI